MTDVIVVNGPGRPGSPRQRDGRRGIVEGLAPPTTKPNAATGSLSGPHDRRYFNPGLIEAYDGADNPEAWAHASKVDTGDRLAGKLLLIHGELDDQVQPDHTLRLADRLIAADKDFELLIVPGAEHAFIDCLAYVRKRCWDFLVREMMGTPPPAYRPAPIRSTPSCSVNSSPERQQVWPTLKASSPGGTGTGQAARPGDRAGTPRPP